MIVSVLLFTQQEVQFYTIKQVQMENTDIEQNFYFFHFCIQKVSWIGGFDDVLFST